MVTEQLPMVNHNTLLHFFYYKEVDGKYTAHSTILHDYQSFGFFSFGAEKPELNATEDRAYIFVFLDKVCLPAGCTRLSTDPCGFII
jgi:hypothetical protein